MIPWETLARPEQLPPPGNWFVWLLRSGRGYGKTRTGAEWVIARARAGYRRIALVGQTKADVRDTMIEVGDSAIMNISPPDFRPAYEPSKRRLTWPNGAIAIVYSGDEPDQLRGPQHDTAWVDELAKFKYPQATWDNLLFGLRLGQKPQITVTTTPRPIPLIRAIILKSTTVDVRRSSYDNIANLSPVYIREVLEPYIGTRLGRQEINGEILEDTPGALWTLALIESLRVTTYPDLSRIVVAIDPAATSTEESNETGIIVAAIGSDQRGYVLEDLTLRATPASWARVAIEAYHHWRADSIVAEVNNGGEMVENTIRTVRDENDRPLGQTVPFHSIHASRGKQIRAEPISALYEQGRISHVGMFAELEDQMCNWIPGDKSPDRLDALVWAFTSLDMISEPVPVGTTAKANPKSVSRWHDETQATGSRWGVTGSTSGRRWRR